MTVIMIAEKPNAASAIAEALADKGTLKTNANEEGVKYYEFMKNNKKHVIVAAVGHLFTLKQTGKGWEYPVFDVDWVPSFKASHTAAFSKKYFDVVQSVTAKAGEEYIVCCDYDEEGSLIGYNILRFLCNQTDAKRMKFSTMTKEELLDSYENAMKHLDMGQVEAGLTRHYLDYMWGISLTRALTLAIKSAAKRFRILSTGRVQGPVLHMLSKHEKKIKAFKPKPFWQIGLEVKAGKQLLKAAYCKDKLWGKDEADKILKKAGVKEAIVKNLAKKFISQSPPKPYNTTSMLSDIYRYFGYSPQQGMSIAEALYQDGLISYPRTSSEKLPKDINYKKILTGLSKHEKYSRLSSSLLSKTELKPQEGSKTDPAHPAIYPTGVIKKIGDKQQKVYDLVVHRFFAVFGDPAKRESQKITLSAGSEIFFLTGKRTVEPGWTELYGRYAARDEILLPDIKVGDKLPIKKAEQLAKETTPPPRFSQGSVLKEMEAQGLGTKCLTGDCKILTPEMVEIRLEDMWNRSNFLCYEDTVEIRKLNTPTSISLNENLGNVEFMKPALISRRKLREREKILRIITKGGELKLTEEHPVYLYDEGIILKVAKDISEGDKLISIISKNKIGKIIAEEDWFLRKNFKIQNNMYVNKFSQKNSLGIRKEKLPIKWSSDLAWILGYFYGDGTYNPPVYNGSHQICFTTTEKKAVRILKTRIQRVFGAEPKAYLVKEGRYYKVQCNSTVASLLAEIFPSINSKKRFHIQEEFIGDFLRGFFDADGNVHLRAIGNVNINGKRAIGHGVPRVKITLASKEHIDWIKDSLSTVGINVSIKEGRAKLNGKYFKCFTILIGGRENIDKFAWKIGFDVEHKRNILYRGLLSDSLQYKRLKACYDITIALKNNTLEAGQLKNLTDSSSCEIEKALNRLVKLGVIKRKRLSPYSMPPNRVIYELIDKEYYLHALKAIYDHIADEFYTAEVLKVEEIEPENQFVYDISVSQDSPNFISNGAILVHNSTRAQILQILYNRGYLIGKSIEVTELGLQLSNILESNIPDVISERLTRHFEEECDAIESGKLKREAVLEEARQRLIKISNAFRKKENKIGKELTDAVIATQDKQNILGTCPKCGGTLKVHKLWRTGKRFVGCSGYKKGCRYGMPLPREGIIMSTEKVCEQCKTPIIQVYRQGARPFRMCIDINCPTKKDWLDKNKLKKARAESKAATRLAEQLTCDICKKAFKTKRALTLHKKTHEK